MKSFYKEWLQKINAENSEVVPRVPISTSVETPKSIEPSQSTSKIAESIKTIPSTQTTIPVSQTDIIFETNELQMIIEKGAFQRQKRFRFQDHLFYVKIKLKNNNQPMPFLKDILDFIHDGLIYLMNTIKIFYNEKDQNICYLTLHQNPMVVGLNSG